VAVLLLAALVLTACGSSGSNGDNPVKAAGVLRVGTKGVYSPFSYHDPATGQLVGYDVDVARAVGDKLGVKVEFVETPWDSIFAALEANRFDVVANEVTINAERKQNYGGLLPDLNKASMSCAPTGRLPTSRRST
jgi:ABC-type amino acid transport substrate-binding protein